MDLKQYKDLTQDIWEIDENIPYPESLVAYAVLAQKYDADPLDPRWDDLVESVLALKRFEEYPDSHPLFMEETVEYHYGHAVTANNYQEVEYLLYKNIEEAISMFFEKEAK